MRACWVHFNCCLSLGQQAFQSYISPNNLVWSVKSRISGGWGHQLAARTRKSILYKFYIEIHSIDWSRTHMTWTFCLVSLLKSIQCTCMHFTSNFINWTTKHFLYPSHVYLMTFIILQIRFPVLKKKMKALIRFRLLIHQPTKKYHPREKVLVSEVPRDKSYRLKLRPTRWENPHLLHSFRHLNLG